MRTRSQALIEEAEHHEEMAAILRRRAVEESPVAELTTITIPDEEAHLPALLAVAFGESRSAGRRYMSAGSVRLDDEIVPGALFDYPAATLDGKILRLGRRRVVRLRVARK